MTLEASQGSPAVLVPRAGLDHRRLARLAGEEFVAELVLELQRVLDVAYVFVLELVGPDRTRSLALAGRAGLLPPVEYELAGTPCQDVSSGESCLVPSGLRAHYPQDQLAVELGLESYVGTSLCDAHGRVVGMIGLADTEALVAPAALHEALLEFAPRLARVLSMRQDAEQVRRLFAGSEAADGSRSFAQLARALAQSLRTRSALVTELLPGEPRRFRVLGLSVADELRADFEGQEIALAGSPCEQVYEHGWMFHARGVARLYPAFAPTMELLGNESYLGLVFSDREGRTLGHVAVAHDRPMREGLSPRAVLEVFARHAALELQRARTEALRLEGERRELTRQRVESLGLLAGGIAHDFNNLLVGILGNTSLAQAEARGELRAHLEEVERAARRATELAHQLLAYAGKGRFLVADMDLSVLAEETARLVRSSLGSGAQLRLVLEAGLPAVRGDATQLRQVLMNLLLNGADAIGPSPGLLTVRTGRATLSADELRACALGAELTPGEYLWFEVVDSGCGMEPATRARILDPFFSTKFTGRGLGLAAVQGILSGHRGALAITSAPGQGSTFRVYLPPALGAPVALAPLAPATDPRRRCVLVVDDEELVRRSATRMLRHLGYAVLEARDGLEALEKLAQDDGRIGIVLLDLTMPGMDGAATFEALRKGRADLPVVLMSGYDERESMARFEAQDPPGFLRKPFVLGELDLRLRQELAPFASA